MLNLVKYLPRKIPARLNFFTFNWVFSFYWGLLHKVLACLVKCRNTALLRRISLGHLSPRNQFTRLNPALLETKGLFNQVKYRHLYLNRSVLDIL